MKRPSKEFYLTTGDIADISGVSQTLAGKWVREGRFGTTRYVEGSFNKISYKQAARFYKDDPYALKKLKKVAAEIHKRNMDMLSNKLRDYMKENGIKQWIIVVEDDENV